MTGFAGEDTHAEENLTPLLRNVFHLPGTEMITYPTENTSAFECYSNNVHSGKGIGIAVVIAWGFVNEQRSDG